jgi:ADP-ribose pyrophosphatase
MAIAWKKISSKIVMENKYFSTEFHKVKLPNGNIIDDYLYINCKNGSIVVAITENNELILLKQYKYGVNDSILTLPGGIAETKNEDLLKTAKREFLEETGYVVGSIKKLGDFFPLPGNNPQHTSVYLALNCKNKQKQTSVDETEFIKVKLFPLRTLKDLIYKNKIKDCMSLAALCLFINKFNNNNYAK